MKTLEQMKIEAAKDNARKVVGITKACIETFKEKYVSPDDLTPLVERQFIAGFDKAAELHREEIEKYKKACECLMNAISKQHKEWGQVDGTCYAECVNVCKGFSEAKKILET
jgi:hypothetical protein